MAENALDEPDGSDTVEIDRTAALFVVGFLKGGHIGNYGGEMPSVVADFANEVLEQTPVDDDWWEQ